MKRILLLTMTAAALLAQLPTPVPGPPTNQYSFDDAFSSTSSETLTLQLPANSNRGSYGAYLTISLTSSSASGKVCYYQNGSTATTTNSTAIGQLNGNPVPPVTKVYTSSNSSGGTLIGCDNFTGRDPVGMTNLFMSRAISITPEPSGTVQNISIVVTGSSISGDIFPRWVEQ